MEKLKDFIEKLKSRPAFQLDVLDCITEKVYQKAVNQEYLDKNHGGSLVNYLNTIHAKGLQKIQLQPRLKNGTSSKSAGAFRMVDFTSGGSSTAQNAVTSAPAQMQMPAGLNAAASFGLGVPDILDGYAAKRELEALKELHRQLTADYKEEKSKKSELRDKLEKAERKLERYGYKEDIQREPSAIDKLIDGLAQNPAMIPQLIGAFKGGSGLNAPNTQNAQIADSLDGYSDMQRGVCELVGQCPDEFCDDLATLISRVFENDKVFNKELKKLIETPTLKTVKNG
tara:strand:- start:80436 stop:81287 length:852 start_codon:yes stop_codon:yes gene_type:complete